MIQDLIDSCALFRQPVFQPNETTPEPVAKAVRINSLVNVYRFKKKNDFFLKTRFEFSSSSSIYLTDSHESRLLEML